MIPVSVRAASISGNSRTAPWQERDCSIDLMLVLDSSNSITPEDYEKMKTFTHDLVDRFMLGPNDANIGIIQFSSSVRLEIGLSDNAEDIAASIDNMEQLFQNTNITGAIHLAQQQFEAGRSGIRKVMIVMTDGLHNVGPGPIPEAEAIRGEGARTRTTILGLAVGNIDLNELIGVAGGEHRVIQAPDYDGLQQVLSLLHDYSCAVDINGDAGRPTPAPDAVTPVGVATTPTPPADASEIVFVSDRTGSPQLYIMNGDGTNTHQLTYNSVDPGSPSWSPDGTHIAFETRMGGTFEIFTIRADGSDLTQITSNDVNDLGPSWSPDGSKIAFHAGTENNFNIYVVNVDGTDRRQITFDSGAVTRSAAWASDSQHIVYFSDASGGREIYVTNIATLETQQLTANTVFDGMPDWSHTTGRIVFTSTRDSATAELYTMNADGSGVFRLTNDSAEDTNPVWSDDGFRIAFESNQAGNYDIWAINADGSGLQQLTPDLTNEWSPDWIGETIVLSRTSSGSRSGGGSSVALMPIISDAIPPKAALEPGTRGAPGGESLANSLQAGEINDNDTFDVYLQYRSAYHTQIRTLVHHVDVSERYIIGVTNAEGLPIIGADVQIATEDGDVVNLRTSASGEAYFFPLAYDGFRYAGGYQVEVTKNGVTATTEITREDTNAYYDVTLEVPTSTGPTQLDVLFLLDTTGSMADEIDALRENILSISGQLDALPGNLDIRYGLVIYRDRGDVYVVQNYDFFSSVADFQRTLNGVSANGGADYQESVNQAMHEAVQNVNWRGGDAVQLLILLADAPPHLDYPTDYDYAQEMVIAAQEGIKIHTVASSGLDEQGEYIFRQMSHFTDGNFVFITYNGAPERHSGADGSVAGSENTYTVQFLDTLIVNLIKTELEALKITR
ncbi:MAG: VWA domain-containing protein [Anaerolineales bacterium]|nr:VWA domain-containing protein [Anaerolineales bacterium]